MVSMGLDPNQHQGAFGESFVRVLASAAGLTVARADLDVDLLAVSAGSPTGKQGSGNEGPGGRTDR